MPTLSISQLAAFTGKDRRTVTDRVANLDFQEGPDRAHLYDSEDALAAIYLPDGKVGPVDAAKIRQAESAAYLNETRTEALRKERIPLEIPIALWDAALQAFTATLKAARGKKLTAGKINELIDKLRTVRLPLKW